jgi:hypothetical protein
MTKPTRRRITVVIHDKPQSQLLLTLGARIATQLQAKLEVVFVEDAALYRLTGLPFLREFKRDSITDERLDEERLLKEWRAMAKLIQEALKISAARAGVDWSFRVWRGEISNELTQLAMESTMLLLGRLTTPMTNRFIVPRGDLHSGPLKLGVILDSSEVVDRLLEAVSELSRKPEIQLMLFLIPDVAKEKADSFQQRLRECAPHCHNLVIRVPDTEPVNLINSLKAAACDLLMISASGKLLQGQNMKQRLSELPYPVVVVR